MKKGDILNPSPLVSYQKKNTPDYAFEQGTTIPPKYRWAPADPSVYSHVGGAAGGGQVEEGEGVDDKAEFLVGEQGVQQDEAQRGDQEGPRPGVSQAQQHRGRVQPRARGRAE